VLLGRDYRAPMDSVKRWWLPGIILVALLALGIAAAVYVSRGKTLELHLS